MKKIAAAVCGGLMLVTTLGACGGNDDFCGKAEDIAGELQGSSDPSKLGDTMSKLADEAPDEIKDDFQALADAMSDPANADMGKLQDAQSNIEEWGKENCDA